MKNKDIECTTCGGECTVKTDEDLEVRYCPYCGASQEDIEDIDLSCDLEDTEDPTEMCGACNCWKSD